MPDFNIVVSPAPDQVRQHEPAGLVLSLLDRVRLLELEVERLRTEQSGPTEFFTRDEAARFLRVSARTISELIGRGQIKIRKCGSRTLIPREELVGCLK